MRIVFLAGAEEDLLDLRRYIARSFGNLAWKKSYQKLKETVRTIQALPHAGVVPDELAGLGLQQYRQAISGMNRIIHEVRGEVVYIHIVCDTRRNMRTLLTRRLMRLVK
jgi:plasmid stabilization system protein ParE